jgi:hypothetical protein
MQGLQRGAFRVLFEPPLESTAREVLRLCPEVKAQLEKIFGWDLDVTTSIFLVRDSGRFQQMSGNPLVVAFAVPKKNLLVIDHSRMGSAPFSLAATLKHEFCHLMLHHHIKKKSLPRWMDEGVCQWASDGVGEILMDPKRSRLNRAAFRGAFIPLNRLETGFPRKRDALFLAYEESKSVISYIIAKFGIEGLLRVLSQMKQGKEAQAAIQAALGLSLEELETQWQHALRKKITWMTYLSYHLYEILFGIGALITLYAFVRVIIRKRAYQRTEGDDAFGP